RRPGSPRPTAGRAGRRRWPGRPRAGAGARPPRPARTRRSSRHGCRARARSARRGSARACGRAARAQAARPPPREPLGPVLGAPPPHLAIAGGGALARSLHIVDRMDTYAFAQIEPMEIARAEIYRRVVSGEVDPDIAARRLLALEMEARRGPIEGPVRRRLPRE